MHVGLWIHFISNHITEGKKNIPQADECLYVNKLIKVGAKKNHVTMWLLSVASL